MSVTRWLRRADSRAGVRSLRAMLVAMAIIVGLVEAAVTTNAVMLTMSWRDAVERDAEALLADQRIAADIVAATYQQQLDAYRYLQSPNSAHLTAFRARGDAVYHELHNYLFRSMSMDVRNQVESIKEAHQAFEVAAERMFVLVRLGRSDSASVRIPDLDARVSRLGSVAGRFLESRDLQRDNARLRHEVLSRRLRFALVVFAIGTLVLSWFLATLVRRLVLRPLDDLTAAAKRLGDGDAAARVPTQPYEEFNVVRVAFNQMAERVRLAHDATHAQNNALRDALGALNATQEELIQHEKLSAMGQMLAGLAHELNNPLAGILGMAECLRSDLSESPHSDARVMAETLAIPLEREALRANALVRSLLSFARMPSGPLESVSLAEAVKTVAALRAHEFAQALVTLNVEVSPDLLVIADSQKLQHAIVNLVNNALDAIVASGGARVDIRASVEGSDIVRLDIEDDGPGFGDIGAAFRPFFTTKGAGKGTGLGLMIVQRFVDELGGSVVAENRVEGGARITVRLQRGAMINAPDPALTANGEPSTRAMRPSAAQRVLVVDDEPSIRDAMRRLLTRQGLDVVLASSGAEARDIMLAREVDLVFSDLRMPGELDGYALFEWMERERPALAANALIATGDITGEWQVPPPVPADRVLRKPFTGAEVVLRIRAALGHQVPLA